MSFYKKTLKLDKLIRKDLVTEYDFVELKSILVNASLYNYFFFHLENKNWFNLLYNSNELTSILNDDSYYNDIYSMQIYVCEYLLRCIPEYQNEVVEIIKNTSTNNFRVYWKFVQIGNKLDSKNTAKLVGEVETWIKENKLHASLIAQEIEGWFSVLLKGNQSKAALKLLRILSNPKIQQPKKEEKEYEKLFGKERSKAIPVFDIYWMKKLLSDGIGKLIKVYPFESAEVLQKSLEKAIRIEYGHIKEKEDLSYIWRAAIEDHSQNFEHYDYKETILIALRNALEVGVSKDKTIGREKFNELLQHEYSIFNRLGIHLVRHSEKKYLSIAKKIIRKKSLYRNASYVHEFYLMLKDLFPLFTEGQQNNIIAIILETQQYRKDDEPYYQKQQIKHWHWEHLSFLRDHLKGETKQYYEELSNEFSTSQFRDTAVWSESSYGERSPVDANELRKKTDEELWKYLKEYEGFESGLDRQSIEGLAREFTTLVEEDPDRFLNQDLSIFIKLYPTYSHHFLGTLESLMRSGKLLDDHAKIEKIIEFISKIIRIEELPEWFLKNDNIRLNFTSVKKRAIDVVRVLIKSKNNNFDLSYKDSIWEIVEYLCFSDQNMDEEQQTNMDPLTVSLNSVSGSAMHLLLDYALWYANHTKSKHEGKKNPNRFAEEERVLKVFEYKLNDKVKNPSSKRLAVHSTFGLFIPNFAYLNKNWLYENLKNIFPEGEEYEPYWNAAFSGFLYRARFYKDLFELLKPQFEKAMHLFRNGKDIYGSGFGQGPIDSIGQYIVIANFHGLDSKVDSKKSLLNQFITMEDNEHITNLAQFISNLAKDERVFETNKEFWETCKKLWRIRIREAKKVNREHAGEYDEDKVDREFGIYLAWLESLPSYEELPNVFNLIKQTIKLNHRGWHLPDFIEFLSKQSEKYPVEAINLFYELMKSDAPRPFFHGKEKETELLLNNAIDTGEKAAINKADIIMNRFGEWGNYYFKELWMERIYQNDKH